MNIVPPIVAVISAFSRHGESEYNVEERIGGDPPLTKRGERYAKALGQYINALGRHQKESIQKETMNAKG